MSELISKIRRSMTRDQGLTLSARASKARRYLAGSLLGPIRLRHCDSVGARARVAGRVAIENEGRIEIGADVMIFAGYAPVQLASGSGGQLQFGDGVHVNYGSLFRANDAVSIGHRVSFGPYCIVDDTAHDARDDHQRPRGDGISIGDDVWLAARVTVLPGATIGAGSVVTAGSIVAGAIPPGVVAGGIPARVLRSLDQDRVGSDPVQSQRSAPRDTPPTQSAQPAPIAALHLRGRVLADFTIGDFAVHLGDQTDEVRLEVIESPYAQTAQYLLGAAPTDGSDFLVVWTRPELVSPAFARLQSGGVATEEQLLADVDNFSDMLAAGAESYRYTFVPTWSLPAVERGRGLTDLRPGGVRWALSIMNSRLSRRHESAPSIYVLDAQRWMQATASLDRSQSKAWYLGKVPFSSALFAEASADIKAAIRALSGLARKLLVLDLDDTLWGGIVGDAGWENLQLGGHDPIGESFVDFQRAVQSLARRGVVLGIVSKNTEEVALDALRSHPDMVLRPEDFVGWRINWRDKAQNIVDLTAELNLGLQSVVFIDDNPVERARVRETLPDVLVPEWPEDKLQYVEALRRLRCFDTAAVSSEDLDRTRLYAAERDRTAAKLQVGSLDEWLLGLGITVRADPLDDSNLARVHQLLNKTNQMNLTTRRLSEAELVTWNREDRHAIIAVSVDDRFGSAGLTGILGLALTGSRCDIVDFVLSCRVMGRRVEEAMLHLAVEWTRAQGADEVHATYHATKKNKPCHDFFRASRFAMSQDESEFTWTASDPYPQPTSLTLAISAGLLSPSVPA